MHIVPVQFDPTVLVSQADRELPPRSSCAGQVHMSQIYHDIEKTVGRSRERVDMPQADLDAYRALGFLWEYAMRLAVQCDDYVRPGEILDQCGIVGSPDLYDVANDRVVETKATYKSFRHMGDNAAGLRDTFWVWDVQMRGYCWLLKTTHVLLYSVFMNGDYRMYKPMFKTWHIVYTAQEITENWQMLVGHARKRGWI